MAVKIKVKPKTPIVKPTKITIKLKPKPKTKKRLS